MACGDGSSEFRVVSDKDLAAVAKLANLSVDDAEAESLRRDLAQVLAYVAKLDEVDTTDVEPSSHAVDIPCAFRKDQARGEKAPDDLPDDFKAAALKAAPEPIGDGFGVPRVIE